MSYCTYCSHDALSLCIQSVPKNHIQTSFTTITCHLSPFDTQAPNYSQTAPHIAWQDLRGVSPLLLASGIPCPSLSCIGSSLPGMLGGGGWLGRCVVLGLLYRGSSSCKVFLFSQHDSYYHNMDGYISDICSFYWNISDSRPNSVGCLNSVCHISKFSRMFMKNRQI